jgi:HK97 family phage prohead protease
LIATPWHIGKDDSCPAGKPVAVIKDDDDSVAGCHVSEASARRQMAALYAQEDANKTMEQINLKAATTVQTDEGLFEAVISTEAVDREKDIVEPAAMVEALKKWNRPIPLSWGHSTKAEDIFGHIEPMTVREADGEVVAQGQVDMESKVGAEAWRSFKNRTIGFSFGYLINEARKRKGGGRHITALDVFEITATPTPMNNDTRVLSTKATAELAERTKREIVEDIHPELTEPSPPPPPPPPGPSVEDRVIAVESTVDQLKRKQEILKAEDVRDEAHRTVRAMVEEVHPELTEEPPSLPSSPSVEDRMAAMESTLGQLKDFLLSLKTEDVRDEADETARAVREELTPELKAELEARPVLEDLVKEASERIEVLKGQFDYTTQFILAQLGVKAVWTTAYINGLPDSAFLYVESGEKDGEGKTVPRSKRHFPYKNAEGSVDLPHLRNALARIPQSNLPQAAKDRATAKARRILESQGKSASSRDPREPDPLRKHADATALDVVGPRQSPKPEEKPKLDLPDPGEIRKKARAEMLELLLS